MNRKKFPNRDGIVYSTDPSFAGESENAGEATLPASEQSLVIRLDSRQRAGKSVTLVEGFAGRTIDLEDLGKKLRTHCGCGGSVKDGIIVIQGDQRGKAIQWLNAHGYTKLRKR
jgi:translation initiation factor 1